MSAEFHFAEFCRMGGWTLRSSTGRSAIADLLAQHGGDKWHYQPAWEPDHLANNLTEISAEGCEIVSQVVESVVSGAGGGASSESSRVVRRVARPRTAVRRPR